MTMTITRPMVFAILVVLTATVGTAQKANAGILGGAIEGAVVGGVLGAVVDGKKGAKKGAKVGAGLGALGAILK